MCAIHQPGRHRRRRGPARLPIVVVEGKGHSIDSGKILVVEEVLLPRQPSALATEIGSQCPDDRIEHRDRRHLDSSAAFLQQLAKRITDQGKQNDAPVRLDTGNYPINLTPRSHHAPDMLDRLRVVELHKAGSGHRVHCLPGGIRYEMKMKPRHVRQNHTGRVIPSGLCIVRPSPGEKLPFRPRSWIIPPPSIKCSPLFILDRQFPRIREHLG